MKEKRDEKKMFIEKPYFPLDSVFFSDKKNLFSFLLGFQGYLDAWFADRACAALKIISQSKQISIFVFYSRG